MEEGEGGNVSSSMTVVGETCIYCLKELVKRLKQLTVYRRLQRKAGSFAEVLFRKLTTSIFVCITKGKHSTANMPHQIHVLLKFVVLLPLLGMAH